MICGYAKAAPSHVLSKQDIVKDVCVELPPKAQLKREKSIGVSTKIGGIRVRGAIKPSFIRSSQLFDRNPPPPTLITDMFTQDVARRLAQLKQGWQAGWIAGREAQRQLRMMTAELDQAEAEQLQIRNEFYELGLFQGREEAELERRMNVRHVDVQTVQELTSEGYEAELRNQPTFVQEEQMRRREQAVQMSLERVQRLTQNLEHERHTLDLEDLQLGRGPLSVIEAQREEINILRTQIQMFSQIVSPGMEITPAQTQESQEQIVEEQNQPSDTDSENVPMIPPEVRHATMPRRLPRD